MGKSNIPVMIFRCMWCGWRGALEEMDMDETDAPAYCPECGHGDFDIREEVAEETCPSGNG